MCAVKGRRGGQRRVLKGLGASAGLAMGPAKVLHFSRGELPRRSLSPEEVPGEIRRLRRAFREARREVALLRERLAAGPNDPSDQILASHVMILQDRELIREIAAAVKAERADAASTTQRVLRAKARYLESLPSEYFSSRAADIRDVEGRLLAHLAGPSGPPLSQVPEGAVLVASELGPAETASLEPGRLAALVTKRGTLTSHVTILARSRGLPAVVAVGDALDEIEDGTLLLVDGDRGIVVAAPNEADLEDFKRRLGNQEHLVQALAAHKARPGVTADGRRIPVLANLGRPEDARAALEAGAEGVGLFRTEFLFLESPSLPDEDTQAQAYAEVARAFGHRPVVIRTLDLGGDKMPALMGVQREANPFLGLRGIRFCLEHEEVFLVQLRAILRASLSGRIKILLPMVGCLDQVRRTREMLQRARDELAKRDIRVPEIELGVMIEVPSAVALSDQLAQETDFFSIGSNDLTQYYLAVDRDNGAISDLYDPLHPGVLRPVAEAIRSAHDAGIQVASCGEVSGDLMGVLALVGLGIDELSVVPRLLPQVKAILASIPAGDLEGLAQQYLRATDGAAVRRVLTDFLADNRHFEVRQEEGELRCRWIPWEPST